MLIHCTQAASHGFHLTLQNVFIATVKLGGCKDLLHRFTGGEKYSRGEEVLNVDVNQAQ